MVRSCAMSRLLTRERLSAAAVLSAMALVVLDAGLINLALPSMAQSLRVRPEDAILIVSVYQAALVVGLLPCAHLADRFGARRLFLAGLGLFSAASVACAFASDLPVLIAVRAVIKRQQAPQDVGRRTMDQPAAAFGQGRHESGPIVGEWHCRPIANTPACPPGRPRLLAFPT